MLALTEWEADLCPCGCGQQMSQSLKDSQIPPEQRPKFGAAFFECQAGLAMRKAQAKQQKTDDAHADATREGVVTGHRLWVVTRKDGEE